MGLSGLLGATLPAYSQIRAGFHIGYLVESYTLESARQNVEDCLWGSGLFSDLAVSLTPGTIENYMIVQGITNYDFADVNDASGAIQDALLACDTGITIKSRDAVAIDFIPADQAGKPGIARPGDYPGNQGSKCDWNNMSLGNYVRCQFGFEPSSLWIVGGIAAFFLLAKRR